MANPHQPSDAAFKAVERLKVEEGLGYRKIRVHYTERQPQPVARPQLQQHELCALFPPMAEEQYQDLLAGIKAHGGLRVPIVLHEGRVLDGWHRLRACRELGIEPKTEAFGGTDDDALGFVIDMNIARRQLDQTQRATVAARIATMRQGERNDLRQNCRTSQGAAAQRLKVSVSSLRAAKRVLEGGAPEVIAAMEAGQLKVSAAKQLVDQHPSADGQRAALAQRASRKRTTPVVTGKRVGRQAKLWQRLERPLTQLAELQSSVGSTKSLAEAAAKKSTDALERLTRAIKYLTSIRNGLPKPRKRQE